MATSRSPATSATAYIEEIYNASHQHSGHGMDGRVPNEVYAACLTDKRTTTAEALDACLRKISRPVTVRRDGVQWEGRHYGHGNVTLSEHAGEKVMLFADPNDSMRVVVRTLGGIKICDAEAETLFPWGAVSTPEWKEAKRKMERHNRQLKEVKARGMSLIRDPMEVLIEDRAEAARGNPHPAPPTPSITMVQTGFEGESKAEEAAFARAVGAESMSPVTPRGLSILAKLQANADESDSGETDSTDPWAILRSRNDERSE